MEDSPHLLTAPVIEGFVNAFLLKNFDKPAPIPDFHREMWEMCCSPRKFVAIAAPRAFAKSTAITHTYVLAALLFRERSFVLVVADTEGQATFFVEDLKRELLYNEDIVKTFGIAKLAKDSTTDFIVEFSDGHQARVIAKGSGQKVRGTKWDKKRPDLIVCDDLENEELVANPERRETFSRWFSGSLLPTRSKEGIIRIVGTILHTDSLLNSLMPRLGRPNRPVYTDDLKELSNPQDIWLSARYRAHNKEMTKSLWPQGKSIEWLKRERQTYLESGKTDLWAQEMLNIPYDEATAPFRRSYFTPMEDGEKEQSFNYYISTDFATQEKQKTDYTVFLVAGINEEGTIYVLKVIQQRMESPEILETLNLLCKRYNPNSVFVEKGQIWSTLSPLVTNEMYKTGHFFSVEELPSITDKRSRSASIRARMKVGQVRFDKQSDWYPDFETECLRFPQGHDDQVDALSLLGLALNKFVEAPTAEEEEEAIREEEMRSSDSISIWESGRSEYTGY